MRILTLTALLMLLSLTASAQETVKPTQESRPANPTTAQLELNLNISADTQYFKLASNQRMENNANLSWNINTLGYRDMRIMVYMTDTKKDNRVAGSSVTMNTILKDGGQEFELSDTDIPINVGSRNPSGKAFIVPIYGPVTTIRVTTKNVSGNIHVAAYLVK